MVSLLAEFHPSLWIMLVGIGIVIVGSIVTALPRRFSRISFLSTLLTSVGTIILVVGFVWLIGSEAIM